MEKIKLAILFGGESSEYSVSLHSAASAIRSVNNDKYEVITIGISPKGEWFLYEGNVDLLEHDQWLDSDLTTPVVLSTNKDSSFICLLDDGSFSKLKVDCILPIMHGQNSEDGTLQGLLELSGIPYVGCDCLCSAMSMDKAITHIICENANIKMADYMIFNYSDNFDYDKAFDELKEKIKFPAFIKPANAGSSYGISKINCDFNEFVDGLKQAFAIDKKVIVETGIDGFEVGTAVLGNDYDNLVIGKIDEINTNKSFFDFDAKYELTDTKIICPARIDAEKEKEVYQIARKVYKAMGCSGLARVDMFISTDGNIYFNELNTIPGFTSASRYPTMMKKINIEFDELIDRLVELALNK